MTVCGQPLYSGPFGQRSDTPPPRPRGKLLSFELVKPMTPIALYLLASPSGVTSVASPFKWFPLIGAPDESISMHLSSPVNGSETGGITPPGPAPPGSNPAFEQSTLHGLLSVGSKRRPVDTNQCVGCCFVNEISKSTSCHCGGLNTPGGLVGSSGAALT